MATVTRLPSGKYRAQVRTRGVYKSRSFTRKGDATAWAADIEKAIRNGSASGTIQPPKDMTLADLIGKLPDPETGEEGSGYLGEVPVGRTVLVNLNRISKRIGKTKLQHLDAMHIADFVTKRRAEGVSGATLAGDLSNLSSVLKWARAKHIDVNAELAKEARRNLTASRIDTRSLERERLPTADELDRILAYVEGNPRQTIPAGTIIRFALASAMRLGEICRIRIEDIDWEERSVLIRERKDPKHKLRNNQRVALVGEALSIAKEQAKGRTNGPLFPYNERSVGAVFTRATRKLGIEDLHFHDLRHAGITNLFRLGLPIQLVATISGHKDWKHLRRYTQLGAADVHEALERAQR